MMSTQIHQFSSSVTYGDGISNQVLSVQCLLRNLGYSSEIFCEHLPFHFEGTARSLAQYEAHSSPENVLILHFGVAYSPRVMHWLKQVPDRKVMVYHNITPHHYFGGIDLTSLDAAQRGRAQLDELREIAEAGWGGSAYNCRELAERGWQRLGILPIVFESHRYAARPDRGVLERYLGGANVLFVGRVSPNKRFEDLILTFYYLKRYVRPDARLLLVGSARGMETYLEFLEALVRRLDLADVVFAGHVGTSQLVAYYRCASVYLSMSEHEGFGVPLLESMYYDLPIVAHKAAAIPETLGGSGVLVNGKEYEATAELIGLLMEDQALRAQIVAKQRDRLQDFGLDRIQGRLRALLDDLGV